MKRLQLCISGKDMKHSLAAGTAGQVRCNLKEEKAPDEGNTIHARNISLSLSRASTSLHQI
jgi:hypothetical protein